MTSRKERGPARSTQKLGVSMVPTEGPSKSLPFASCGHRALPSPGYYTQISTLADAQENVMEYLHVLSRPMVINHDHDVIWTEAYMDSRVRTMMGPDGQGGQS